MRLRQWGLCQPNLSPCQGHVGHGSALLPRHVGERLQCSIREVEDCLVNFSRLEGLGQGQQDVGHRIANAGRARSRIISPAKVAVRDAALWQGAAGVRPQSVLWRDDHGG